MSYMDATGNVVEEGCGDRAFSRWLYTSKRGRRILQVLISPGFAFLTGRFLDTPLSKVLIGPSIRRNQIDMSLYEERKYLSYNDFFTREIKQEERMIDYGESHLVSPSDGYLTAYHIREDSVLTVKHAKYDLATLLHSRKLAKKFQGGTAVIIRLGSGDYHRYCYPADGNKSRNFHIRGVYHALDPKGCPGIPVYQENTREFTLLQTERFGGILQMEVGAMLVGRINNFHSVKQVRKGEEKGCFDFGGSAIVLLFEKQVQVKERFFENTAAGCETRVNMGEWIASPAAVKER